MSDIDKNRILLSDTNAYNNKKLCPLLFAPIKSKDVPMYSTTELKSVTVDINSPENKEALVDMQTYGIKTLAYYRQEAHGNPTYNSNISGAPDIIYARESVCKKIQEANKLLQPLGLEVIVYDAHRSPATQKKLYDFFVHVAEEKGLQGSEAHHFAATYCSNPEGFDKNNPKTWTMHSTGAAIDLYLFDTEKQKVIDMGEGYFDNPDEVTHTQYYEDLNKKGALTQEQKSYRDARRLLFNTMKQAGFYNYGSELFHYEYKGLIEAKVMSEKTGHDTPALYGYALSPADDFKARLVLGLLQKQNS